MTKILILFNMALLLRTKCTRTGISRPPSGNGDDLGVTLSTNWSSLMKEIKCKSWKFSSYMSNCDITNSIYAFDHNLATIWVGINWYTVGFFQNFNLLVQRYISSSCFSVYVISLATNFRSERVNGDFKIRQDINGYWLSDFSFSEKNLIEYESFILFFFVIFSNFSDVLFIVSFKNHFEKTDSEHETLRHGYSEILRKIHE